MGNTRYIIIFSVSGISHIYSETSKAAEMLLSCEFLYQEST